MRSNRRLLVGLVMYLVSTQVFAESFASRVLKEAGLTPPRDIVLEAEIPPTLELATRVAGMEYDEAKTIKGRVLQQYKKQLPYDLRKSKGSTVIAWIPQSMGQVSTAVESVFKSFFIEHLPLAARDSGAWPKYVVESITDGAYLSAARLLEHAVGKEMHYEVRIPIPVSKPVDGPSFTSGKQYVINDGVIRFPNEAVAVNEVELLRKATASLPQSVFIFVPANALDFKKGRPNRTPLLLRQGNVHYFVSDSAS